MPPCPAATKEARGSAVVHIANVGTSNRFHVVANNLPGDLTAVHIHSGKVLVRGRIVQDLPLDREGKNGQVASGQISAVVANLIQRNPREFYVDVHTSICPDGAIRGQLDQVGG